MMHLAKFVLAALLVVGAIAAPADTPASGAVASVAISEPMDVPSGDTQLSADHKKHHHHSKHPHPPHSSKHHHHPHSSKHPHHPHSSKHPHHPHSTKHPHPPHAESAAAVTAETETA